MVKKKKKKKPAKKKAKKKKIAKKIKKKKIVKEKKKAAKKKKISLLEKAVASGVSVEEVGVITHYFPHVEAAVVKMTRGTLSLGDTIIVNGHTTDFKTIVKTMQLEHTSIDIASVGQEIGMGVKAKVREHDVVYKLL